MEPITHRIGKYLINLLGYDPENFACSRPLENVAGT